MLPYIYFLVDHHCKTLEKVIARCNWRRHNCCTQCHIDWLARFTLFSCNILTEEFQESTKWSQVRNMKHRTKNPQNEIWFVQRQSWQHCFRRNQLYYNPWYLVLQNSKLKIFSCLNVNFLKQELGVILSSCKVDFFVLNGWAKVPFTSLQCIKHELIHSPSVDLSLLYLLLVQVFV